MPATTQNPSKIVRVPILGSETARDATASKDQRYVNGYFEIIKNQITGAIKYFFTKRPGLSQLIRPSAGAATPRGCYFWNNIKYSVFGNTIYSNSTALTPTMVTSTGRCSFQENSPSASLRYLAINDGTQLYVISPTNVVSILNNLSISAFSVANPSEATTTVSHGLASGMIISIQNSTCTPTADGEWVITVTAVNKFTIPLNVTITGTAIAGNFPQPNNKDLVYMDGFLFTSKPDGTIWNCKFEDPPTWRTDAFITAEMIQDGMVGLVKQKNLLMALGNFSTEFFFDAGNITGSPVSKVEQAVQQLGAVNFLSICRTEDMVYFVSDAQSGEHGVYMFKGIGDLTRISEPPLDRILELETTNLNNCYAWCARLAGHHFYVLNLTGSNRTFVYDIMTQQWFEWESAAGSTVFPIYQAMEVDDGSVHGVVVQHLTNGWLYNFRTSVYQDDSVNFIVTIRTSRMDFDTNTRKFCINVELIGDRQATTTNVNYTYSDDDYQNFSAARIYDMSEPYGTGQQVFGFFRRRAHRVQYTGSNPFRIEAIEIEYDEEENL